MGDVGVSYKRAKFSMRALRKIVSAANDARAAFQMWH
jgi:hypothetical protein